MSDLKVSILGCGSALPTRRHQPSCQIVSHGEKLFMIDCGEGAQGQMRQLGFSFTRLNHIFFSHLHGDHCFGLLGLLSTMALHYKQNAVVLHMFQEGIDVFRPTIEFFCRENPFPIIYEPVDPKGGLVYEDKTLTIEAFPLYHRLPCVGYIFREKEKLRPLRQDMISFYNVPVRDQQSIREGQPWTREDGTIIDNQRLTTDPTPSLSYAYASDTVFEPKVAEAVKGVDLLYHEATYSSKHKEMARPRGHSTAQEAAQVASMAGVGQLMLGHFSKRYKSEESHLLEAQEIFPNTILAQEGLTVDVKSFPKQAYDPSAQTSATLTLSTSKDENDLKKEVEEESIEVECPTNLGEGIVNLGEVLVNEGEEEANNEDVQTIME